MIISIFELDAFGLSKKESMKSVAESLFAFVHASFQIQMFSNENRYAIKNLCESLTSRRQSQEIELLGRSLYLTGSDQNMRFE